MTRDESTPWGLVSQIGDGVRYIQVLNIIIVVVVIIIIIHIIIIHIIIVTMGILKCVSAHICVYS